ncbi:DNRLRE domain-containing protein [Sorangium sp. So ce1024]|uniref:DNRLRE domain-containing protein n=1 Tax=Sorangium sp. So ce1024 TaxID=3133327 RepID=UPI003F108878
MERWVPNTARRISWIALALLATGPAAGQTVTLHPGTLSGVISLGSETISSGYVYAYAIDDSGYNAQADINESSYTLTVEAGRSYRPQLFAYINNGSGTTYMQTTGGETPEVSPESITNHPFSHDVARISGTINVTDGTVSSYTINAGASEGDQSYSSYSAKSDTSTISIPMILDSTVQVWGSAIILLPSGASVTLPLEPRTVALGVGGASVEWTIDTRDLEGSITASISTPGPDIVRSHYVRLNDTSSGAWNATLYSDGDYTFSPLAPGRYWLGADTYFDEPYGYLIHPTQRVTLPHIGNETRTLGGGLAFLRGHLDVRGFHELDDVLWAVVRARRSDPSGTWDSYDYVDLESGNFDLAVIPGDWTIKGYEILFNEPHPTTPVNARIYRDTLLGEPASLGAGDDVGGQTLQLTTVWTQIVYNIHDGMEDEDSENQRLMSNPRLFGWNDNGYYIEATGPSIERAHPALQIVGVPGTYDVYASATVAGSQITFAHFPFRIREPAPLAAGEDAPPVEFRDLVPDHPEHTLKLNFGRIQQSGLIAVTASPIGPTPPHGFKMTVGGRRIVYYDIKTTAEFAPPVQICMSYHSDLSADQEFMLDMLHFTDNTDDGEDNPEWHTMINDGFSPDYDANVICANAGSFSIFALMERNDAGPEDIDLDGPSDDADNCPLVANADQSDADADGVGDACDNCPVDPNPVQSDADANGFGNACDPVCVTVERGVSGSVQDAYIATGEPNNRTGAYEFFATGMHSSGEKMGLVAFDLGAIPEDATVQSAALSVSMQWQATSGTVDVHAVTAPWSEATVTYTSFGGAFDPAVEASFVAPAGIDGRQSCDVTALAQGWVDGSLPNNGMLLRELGPNKHSFRTSEHARADAHPRLDVCYVTP